VAAPFLTIGQEVVCDALPSPVARWSIAAFLDRVHSASAALICFARGVNDTPKLAALLIAANLSGARLSVTAIAIAMAVGGLLLARRVAETMSRRVTRMNYTQGVAANLITAVLVLGASQLGLPVSTTHVSVGSIAGVGAGAHTLNWQTLRNILLSWIATLPLAAGAAWVAMSLF
jgi:PiT family inorganic phosphate transporter